MLVSPGLVFVTVEAESSILDYFHVSELWTCGVHSHSLMVGPPCHSRFNTVTNMVTGYRWLSGAGHTTQELPNLRSKCKHVQEANLALGA